MNRRLQDHSAKLAKLQEKLKDFHARSSTFFLNLHYHSGNSNTTRSKLYKQEGDHLDFQDFNEIIQINPEKRVAIVEPRVTMEQLAKATLAYGLMPPVVPEFKGITVGGAIAGGAAESSSHRWGGFNDACSAIEILCGDGTVLRATSQENADIFYGISGSYGAFGPILSAEFKLIPAQKHVRLRYHALTNPLEALELIQSLVHAPHSPDFIDGMVFAKDLAVVIEGSFVSDDQGICPFSMKSSSAEWYFQHVQKKLPESFEEVMTLEEYLFRYDQGAFWMGAYLFHLPLLSRFATQGVFKLIQPKQESFSKEEVEKFHRVPSPNLFWRTLMHPFLSSQKLWGLLHKAEKWIQDRIIIQDFCIPERKAFEFFQEILSDPGTFPFWICPIKGTPHPQIFAPHLLPQKSLDTHFINFGIYGLPSYFAPIDQITKRLEKKAQELNGRKVLYSRSYYSEEEFWQIYSREAYDALREKTGANGVWRGITEKVLSV